MAVPKMSRAQRRALARLATGETVQIVQGEYYLGDQPLHRGLLIRLAENGWATLPQPAHPLFGIPAQPGLLTDAGRTALAWSWKNA
jgi:hypothetical protein